MTKISLSRLKLFSGVTESAPQTGTARDQPRHGGSGLRTLSSFPNLGRNAFSYHSRHADVSAIPATVTPPTPAPVKKLDIAEVALPAATMQKIADEVVQRCNQWDEKAINDFDALMQAKFEGVRQTYSVADAAHVFNAFLMDAVFRHHSQGNPAVVLSKQDMDSLFNATKAAMEKGAFQNSRSKYFGIRKIDNFVPSMKESLEIMLNEMDQLDRFKQIDHAHRSKLVIDPAIMDSMKSLDIDMTNPLLAFVFDGSTSDKPGYALGVLQGWVRIAKLSGEKLDLDKLLELSDDISDEHFTDFGNPFGCLASPAGRQRIGHFMDELDRTGWNSVLNDFSYRYFVKEGKAKRIENEYCREKRLPLPEGKEFSSVAQIMAYENEHDGTGDQMKRVKFHRRFMRALDDSEDGFHAKRFIAEKLQLAEGIEALPKELALRRIAQIYLDCESFHPKENGNYRLFGLLVVNALLAKCNLPLAVLADPNFSDGCSYEEVADMIGQAIQETLRWNESSTRPAK